MLKIPAVIKVLSLATLLALAACGGGGGGGGGGATPPVTGFTKNVSLPVAPAGDWNLFSSGAGSKRYQALVRAQDIRGSGPLRSLAFRRGADSIGNSCPNVTIKLVHRPVSATLDTTFANNVTPGRGAVTTVFGPATLTIPAEFAGEYFTIPLNGAFNYNGVDNLIVDIETDGCSANTVIDARDANPVYTALIYHFTDRTAPTGSTWNSLADMKFTFAGGDNRVQSPGALGLSSFPFTAAAGGAKVQLLYYSSAFTSDEIDGSGPITGIAFPIAGGAGFPPGPVTAQTHTVTVKLGHSTLTALTDTFANNFNSGAPVTVANAVTFEIPAGVPAGRYLWAPLPDGTFNYNGTDNLIVEIEASAAPAFTWTTTHEDTLSQRRLSASSGATTGMLDRIVNDIQLRFAGGGMDAITPDAMSGGLSDSFPFANINGKRQFLYRAAELGTRGTISKIACRTNTGGPSTTGFNYSVVLSHSTASTLDTSFATNLVSPVTVFSGTFNLPAMVAGDWIEIPLTTPFAYNGRHNLVLEIGGTGGESGGGIFSDRFACARDDASTALYAGRRLFGATSTDATGSVSNSMIDTRFTLQ